MSDAQCFAAVLSIGKLWQVAGRQRTKNPQKAKRKIEDSPTMKLITLWQPWASAMSLSMKRIETRSWGTDYRGPLAIHAALTWGRSCKEALQIDDIWEPLRRAFGIEFCWPSGRAVELAEALDIRRRDSGVQSSGLCKDREAYGRKHERHDGFQAGGV